MSPLSAVATRDSPLYGCLLQIASYFDAFHYNSRIGLGNGVCIEQRAGMETIDLLFLLSLRWTGWERRNGRTSALFRVCAVRKGVDITPTLSYPYHTNLLCTIHMEDSLILILLFFLFGLVWFGELYWAFSFYRHGLGLGWANRDGKLYQWAYKHAAQSTFRIGLISSLTLGIEWMESELLVGLAVVVVTS